MIAVDSGASKSFTPNAGFLHNYLPCSNLRIKIANGTICSSKGVGTMCITSRINGQLKELLVPNTYHVPSFANTLLSAIDLTDRNYTIIMEKMQCRIVDPNGELKAIAAKERNLFRICNNAWTDATAYQATTLKIDLELLHRRLGHASVDRIKKMVENGMVTGVTLTETEKLDKCEVCIRAKQT